MTESEIIAGCIRGSMKHQKALYDRYAPLMMGVCMRYAGNEQEAEDVLQEGFITVFRKIDSFEGKGELGAWLRKVFLNTALMQYRKNKARLQDLDVDVVGFKLEATGDDPFDQLQAADLMEMIQKLPAGARLVFNLYAVEGFDHNEIASQLGISSGTSKSQYHRARELLRHMIEKEAHSYGNAIWR
jgi:RNA polymerase sigma factor (sigma-70 family)